MKLSVSAVHFKVHVHDLKDLLTSFEFFYMMELNDGNQWFCVQGRTFSSPSDWCCSKGLLHVMTHTEVLVLDGLISAPDAACCGLLPSTR